MPEVVVTGDGCVSALGPNVPETMENLYAGRIQPPEPHSLSTSLTVQPPVFRVTWPLDDFGLPDLTRTSQLALWALREAIQVAGAGSLEVAPDRLGISLGTTSGCTFNDEDFFMQFRAGGEPDIAPFGQYLDNDVARVVADYVGARGPVVTVANACASGTDAIGCGAAWLRSGVCDLVVAGGADELCRFPYLGFISLQNTSPERCRPFDLHRKGLNLGEGAAIVILEREEDARRRGARILARLSGYASASDAYHPTSPHPEGRGLRKAMHLALRAAGLEATEIAFVNAHGTGTAENDRVEGRVLADLLSPSLRIFSTKGYTGHATGAAGAVEAVLTIRNLLDQRVPRSGGFQTADPECAVVPTTETRDVRCRAAISNSLAFGGTNSVLVFRRGDAS